MRRHPLTNSTNASKILKSDQAIPMAAGWHAAFCIGVDAETDSVKKRLPAAGSGDFGAVLSSIRRREARRTTSVGVFRIG